MTARPPRILAALLTATLFLAFAWPGLRAGFTDDDLMNTWKAWNPPVTEHLRDTFLFWRFSDSFRPVGALFYRLLFETFGLHPAPYRIACYALILLNVWLAYAVLGRIAKSRQVGALGAMLLAYHGQFWGLYTNTGMCYDLLCFSFYTCAFLYYLRARERALPVAWRDAAVWAGLYILALNSKEMAVSLPVVMLVYELLASPPDWKRPFAWLSREGRVPLAGGAMTALFLAGRIWAPAGLPSMEAYRPTFSLQVYLDRAHHYLHMAFYQPEWLTPAVSAVFLLLLLALAAAWRSLPFRLGVVWALVGILPVALIGQRGLDAASTALPGFALAIAAALSALAGRIRLRPAVAFAATLAALVLAHSRYSRVQYDAFAPHSRRIGAIHEQLRARQQVPFTQGSRILFLEDPFPETAWNSTFLVYLTSRDRTLIVKRADHLIAAAPPDTMDFDVIFSTHRDRLVECDATRFRGIRASDLPSLKCGHAD